MNNTLISFLTRSSVKIKSEGMKVIRINHSANLMKQTFSYKYTYSSTPKLVSNVFECSFQDESCGCSTELSSDKDQSYTNTSDVALQVP